MCRKRAKQLDILYLGLGASALCFVTWKFAVKELGAVKTSVYIYMVPVITVITSVLILHEKLTLLAGIGTVLTLIGLFLSEYKPERNRTINGLHINGVFSCLHIEKVTGADKKILKST